MSATTLNALVQFYILITHKTLVVESVFLKHLTTPTSERHSINLAR